MDMKTGAFVRDRTLRQVCGFVVSCGALKFGRRSLSGYRVRLASGAETVILDGDTEVVPEVLDCTPPQDS